MSRWVLSLVRCNNLISFELLQYPRDFDKLTVFYSFPTDIAGFVHITNQQVFDLKIQSQTNTGQAIVDNIRDHVSLGFRTFFVNPAGIDRNGTEIILNYMGELSENSNNCASLVLIINHDEYHSYFEDDCIMISPMGKRKNVFGVKSIGDFHSSGGF